MTPLKKAASQGHPLQEVRTQDRERRDSILEVIAAMSSIKAATEDALAAAANTATALGATPEDLIEAIATGRARGAARPQPTSAEPASPKK